MSGPLPSYSVSPRRRLVRPRDHRMLGGVCAGIAAHLGVDVTVVRLLAVIGAVLGFGSLIVAYVVLWILLPQG